MKNKGIVVIPYAHWINIPNAPSGALKANFFHLTFLYFFNSYVHLKFVFDITILFANFQSDMCKKVGNVGVDVSVKKPLTKDLNSQHMYTPLTQLKCNGFVSFNCVFFV